MRNLLIALLLIITAEMLFQRCANPRSPSGGPRDTIPPSLIMSIPPDQTINFKEQEITLYFDEYINADKLTQQLIITPNTDIKYKHIIKRRSITIKFDEPLQDSSTYTFNFFDGVTDATEKNPVKNLILALSTGSYIDSLRVIGSVKDLFTAKPQDKTTVGLFQLTDSLDVTEQSPYYFIATDKNGTFELKNLKYGKYRIISFTDENRNMKLDAATEAYGFLTDTIIPSTEPDSIHLYQIKVNSDPLKFISARPSGLTFDIRYSKPIEDYTTLDPNGSAYSYSKLNADKDAIQFYNINEEITDDSTIYIVTARDSINQLKIDTVSVKFRKSARKPIPFELVLSPSKGAPIASNTPYNILFSKPVESFDSAFLNLKLDTIATIPMQANNIRFNYNRTSLSFSIPFSQNQFIDTLSRYQSLYEQTDTLNIDSLALQKYNILTKLSNQKPLFQIKPASFISTDSDSSESILQSYAYPMPENFGEIKLTITTSIPSYQVQLLDKSNNIYTTVWNCKSCNFKTVPPNEYYVRILVDDNNNGKYEVGNIRQLIEPERVIIFPEKSILRANWALELTYSFN